MAWTGSGEATGGCTPINLIPQSISPTITARVFASGQTQIDATGGTVALSVVVVSSGSVLGQVTMGPAVTAPTTPTPMSVSGVILDSSTSQPLELPPGTYDIRFRMTKGGDCESPSPATLTATRPMLSVVTLGTTP